MKLTVFLLTVCFLNVCAKGVSQNITFSGENVSLQSVFSVVKKQTGFVFMYTEPVLGTASPVTINAKNIPLKDFLTEVFNAQPLRFSIRGKIIAIAPKPLSAEQSRYNELTLTPPPFTVSGRVVDENGRPLAGASVSVKGGKTTAITVANGFFTLTAEVGQILFISYIGFSSVGIKITSASTAIVVSSDRQELIVNSDKTRASTPPFVTVGQTLSAGTNGFVIMLPKAGSQLDEVQVIAYGTTSKRYSTGNIGTVKSTDIEKQPVSNPLLALQGRIPGMLIEQSSGLPGAGVKVRIQGENSIGKGNDPLYVIDGVPYSPQLIIGLSNILGESGNSGIGGNPLSFINPQDIESIDVLKDADATAIYGSRAANGAILITTKKGRSGATRINFNIQNGWGKITRKMDLMNTEQYLAMRKEALENDGIDITQAPNNDSITNLYVNPDLVYWDQQKNTDWQEVLLGGTARYSDAQLSLSGGSDNTSFLLSAGLHNEKSVFPGSTGNKRGSMHFNLNNSSFQQKLNIQFSASFSSDKNQLHTDYTNFALYMPPNAPSLYNEDGTLNWAPVTIGGITYSSWSNPLADLNNKYTITTNNLVSNAIVGYKILPGLELKSNFGYTFMQVSEIYITPLTSKKPENRPYETRFSTFADNNSSAYIVEPQLTFNKQFGFGKLDILAGATYSQNSLNGKRIIGTGYNSDELQSDINSAGTLYKFGSVISTYKYSAVFGRVNYNWSDKLIFNATIRRDGSSRFGSENMFHNFWSVAGAWIFTNEAFFKEKLSFLSFGKLKSSYGTTGNDQIGDYSFLNLYDPQYAGNLYQNAIGLLPRSLPNPYLQWEETRKLMFGIDLGFVKDRILLNVIYARNRSSNQLLAYKLPITTGFGAIERNFPATVQNSSVEMTAIFKNISTKSFTWTTSFNLTIPRTKLIAFPDLENSAYANAYKIGYPVSVFRYYPFAGVNAETGLYEVYDANGNRTSTPSETDKTVLLGTNQQYYGGFQNSFTYKGFSLDVLFQFVNQVGRNCFFPFIGNFGNVPAVFADRWQKPGDITNTQQYSTLYPATGSVAEGSTIGFSDATYFRLKNMSLSWSLPSKWLQVMSLQQAKLYVQGQNLLTFTNYLGMDPENRTANSLPPLRILTFGINVTL